jgi:mRNA interferase HicA
VKRNEFVRSLARRGCYLHHHGSRHDIYANSQNGRKAPVPRHPEIRDSLARLIETHLGIL